MAKGSTWDDIAKNIQQSFYELFGKYSWDSYKDSEREYLLRKIGCVLFGPPSELKKDSYGYSGEQYKRIQNVFSAIVREDRHGTKGETYMSLTFVCLKIQDEKGTNLGTSNILLKPVFRVPRDSSESSSFIDDDACVYKTWEDFLKNKKLPSCRYCYPRGGIYQCDKQGRVLVKFVKKPGENVTSKVLHTFSSLSEPLATLSLCAGAAYNVYSVICKAYELIYRTDQSISEEDVEDDELWFNLLSNMFVMASTRVIYVIKNMAQAGMDTETVRHMTHIDVGNWIIDSLSILYDSHELYIKFKNNELTDLDVLHFTYSIYLFGHTVLTTETADTIIRENSLVSSQKLQINLCHKMDHKDTSLRLKNVKHPVNVVRHLKYIRTMDDFKAYFDKC